MYFKGYIIQRFVLIHYATNNRIEATSQEVVEQMQNVLKTMQPGVDIFVYPLGCFIFLQLSWFNK